MHNNHVPLTKKSITLWLRHLSPITTTKKGYHGIKAQLTNASVSMAAPLKR